MPQARPPRDREESSESVASIETPAPKTGREDTAPAAGDWSAPAAPAGPASERAAGSLSGDLLNVLRGFCMGAADTVPGVSGGTVALILGHYQRLVTAISHVDGRWLKLASQRRYQQAAAHVDARFLIALGIGIGIGVISLAGAMHWLLDHHLPGTLAVFFGLVLASAWIVAGHVDRWTPWRLAGLLAGAAAALSLNWLPAVDESALSLPRLFLSAAVAICAMILPGISGAFILLLLGAYRPVTGLVRRAAEGELSLELMWQLAAFAAGCAVGLLTFARLLRWLLEHRRGATMAVLLGLMLGSISQLWPLQMPAAGPAADIDPEKRPLVYVSPADWPGSLLPLLALAVVAAVLVLVVERIAHRAERQAGSAHEQSA